MSALKEGERELAIQEGPEVRVEVEAEEGAGVIDSAGLSSVARNNKMGYIAGHKRLDRMQDKLTQKAQVVVRELLWEGVVCLFETVSGSQSSIEESKMEDMMMDKGLDMKGLGVGEG